MGVPSLKPRSAHRPHCGPSLTLSAGNRHRARGHEGGGGQVKLFRRAIRSGGQLELPVRCSNSVT